MHMIPAYATGIYFDRYLYDGRIAHFAAVWVGTKLRLVNSLQWRIASQCYLRAIDIMPLQALKWHMI
jgi:hypothetical protein